MGHKPPFKLSNVLNTLMRAPFKSLLFYVTSNNSKNSHLQFTAVYYVPFKKNTTLQLHDTLYSIQLLAARHCPVANFYPSMFQQTMFILSIYYLQRFQRMIFVSLSLFLSLLIPSHSYIKEQLWIRYAEAHRVTANWDVKRWKYTLLSIYTYT